MGKRGVTTLVLVIVILFLGWFDFRRKGQPKLILEEVVLNYDRVRVGETAVKPVRMRNAGRANLVITKLVTGCSCTTATVDQAIIPPGESTYLRVSFRGSGVVGPQGNFVGVYSNDDVEVPKMISVAANVFADVKIDPAAFDFGDLSSDSLQKRPELTLFIDADDTTLGGISAPYNWLAIETIPIVHGRSYRIVAALTKSAPIGLLGGTVEIRLHRTNNPDRVLTASIMGSIKGRFRAEPSGVVALVSKNHLWSQTVTIKDGSSLDAPLEFSSVRASPEISPLVSIETSQKSGQIYLSLRKDAESRLSQMNGRAEGMIYVEVDDIRTNDLDNVHNVRASVMVPIVLKALQD